MTLAAGVANRLYLAYAAPSRRRFEMAARDPSAAQHALLLDIVRANQDSRFGRAHGFARIRNMADFRARVPLRDYQDIEPDIGRLANGEHGVLTTEPVTCLEPTGGSSGAMKLVPYTGGLLRQISAATLPWIHDLLTHRPALRNGRAYWAITPPARHAAVTAGGVPIGMSHDSDYFPAFARALLDRVLGAPRAVSRAPDVESARYITLRALLALPDLAFISVWNPSFLTLLADALDENFPQLLRDLECGGVSMPLDPSLAIELRRVLPAQPTRASELRRRFGMRPPEDLGDLWTRLTLISCWTDAHAGRALIGLRRRLPRVEVQGKGLLATEGVVSFPLFDAGGGGSVAAVTSHVLEFLPVEGGDALGVAELDVGGVYEVVLTTAGGLYRYQLKDVVRVESLFRRAPVLSFQGRADHASDLVGEKLTPAFAETVLRDAAAVTGLAPAFALLAPSWGEADLPHYDLCVECGVADAEHFARAAEARLLTAHHYALARRLGQLGAVRAIAVADGEGARVYERICLEGGQRAGAIKPAALDDRLDLGAAFARNTGQLGAA